MLYYVLFIYFVLGVQHFYEANTIQYPWYEQIARQELLISSCTNFNLTENPSAELYNKLDHVLVDKKHSLLYCYVPKVACTNWKRILMVLSGKMNNTKLSNIPASLVHENTSLTKITQLNSDEAANFLNIYINDSKSQRLSNSINQFENMQTTRLIVVRHPFERLLSAYRNKLEDNRPSAKYFQARIGRYIIKKYRTNPSNFSLNTGSDVTFREFIQYLISEALASTNDEDINEHWRPIYKMCLPCTIDYNFIVKYEHLIEDAEMLLDLIKATNIDFPMTRVSRTNKKLNRDRKSVV